MPSFRVSRSLTIAGAAGVGPFTVAVSPAADPARAFPRLTSNLKTGAGRDVASTTTLDNRDIGVSIPGASWIGSSFDLLRATGAEAQNHRFYSEVVEDVLSAELRPAHGMYVRTVDDERLLAGVLTITTGVVPGILNLGQCIVWPIATRSAFAGQEWSDAAATVELDGLGQVVITRGQALGTSTQSFAVPEFGTAWTVRHVTLSTATRGADVAIPGCGAEPWSQKAFVASWRAPAGADGIADVPTIRASPSDPDAILWQNPIAGAAGVFDVSVYVLYHAGLYVQHWSSIDQPAYGDLAVNATDTLIDIPFPVTGDEDQVSIIGTADHDANNLGYPRMHIGWFLEPGGTQVRARRGKVTDRPSRWALQAIRWPDGPSDPYDPRGEIVRMWPVGMIGR